MRLEQGALAAESIDELRDTVGSRRPGQRHVDEFEVSAVRTVHAEKYQSPGETGIRRTLTTASLVIESLGL